VFEALQRALLAHKDLWDQVALNTASCLGPCFDGPNIVVYPEGVWYAGVQEEDVAEIVSEHLVGGRVVERLRYSWPEDDLSQ
jgi:(2Fe-2S) ferredoxin